MGALEISSVAVLVVACIAIAIELYVISDLKATLADLQRAVKDVDKAGDLLASHRITLAFKDDRENELGRKVAALQRALEAADKHREELLHQAEKKEYDKEKEVEVLKSKLAILTNEIGTLRDERYAAIQAAAAKRWKNRKKGPIAE